MGSNPATPVPPTGTESSVVGASPGGELLHGGSLDHVRWNHSDPACGCGTERRHAGAAAQRGSLAEDGAWPDFGHLLAVDLDTQYAVQQQVQLVACVSLLDQRVALL